MTALNSHQTVLWECQFSPMRAIVCFSFHKVQGESQDNKEGPNPPNTLAVPHAGAAGLLVIASCFLQMQFFPAWKNAVAMEALPRRPLPSCHGTASGTQALILRECGIYTRAHTAPQRWFRPFSLPTFPRVTQRNVMQWTTRDLPPKMR